jgi:predicted transcriptional regulator
LYDDFLELNGKYPEIDLGYKGDQMRHSFLIKERKIIRTKGNKEIILKLMENKSLTVNEIAKLIKMTRQGVRYHIKNLLKDDKICIVSKFNENNYIYGVKNAYRNSRES